MEALNTYKSVRTNEPDNIKAHSLSMEKRKDCKITGVIEVCSFDENAMLMETTDGMLLIRGSDMHVSRLNLEKGEADIEGRVDMLQYTEKTSFAKKGEGLLSRLFG